MIMEEVLYSPGDGGIVTGIYWEIILLERRSMPYCSSNPAVQSQQKHSI
jgi:hypothetical protein